MAERATPFLVTPVSCCHPLPPSCLPTFARMHSPCVSPSLSLLEEGQLQGYFVTFVSPAPGSGFDSSVAEFLMRHEGSHGVGCAPSLQRTLPRASGEGLPKCPGQESTTAYKTRASCSASCPGLPVTSRHAGGSVPDGHSLPACAHHVSCSHPLKTETGYAPAKWLCLGRK